MCNYVNQDYKDIISKVKQKEFEGMISLTPIGTNELHLISLAWISEALFMLVT